MGCLDQDLLLLLGLIYSTPVHVFPNEFLENQIYVYLGL
jgi:hypothetical protein